MMAQIIAELPSTVSALQEKFGCLRCTVEVYLSSMCRFGLVHRSGLTETKAAIWSSGKGEDIRGRYVFRQKSMKTVATFAHAYRALERMHTIKELAEESGMSEDSTRCLVRAMKEAGLVYIAGWEPAGQFWASQWMIGNGRDVKRPAGASRKEQNRAAWQRRKMRRLQASVNDALFVGAA